MAFPLRRLLLIAFLVGGLQAASHATEKHKTLASPRPLSDFSLRNQHGSAVGIESLKGQWSMIMLGFTSCPDICPLTLSHLEAVRAELGLRTRPDNIPAIIFLAVDPQRDTPVLKRYLAHFHPAYLGLTGATAQLDSLVKDLGGFYRLERKMADGSYTVQHSAMVFIVNPDAEVVAEIYPPFHAHNTAEYLMTVIHGRSIDD